VKIITEKYNENNNNDNKKLFLAHLSFHVIFSTITVVLGINFWLVKVLGHFYHNNLILPLLFSLNYPFMVTIFLSFLMFSALKGLPHQIIYAWK
jgi:hypothetical protein